MWNLNKPIPIDHSTDLMQVVLYTNLTSRAIENLLREEKPRVFLNDDGRKTFVFGESGPVLEEFDIPGCPKRYVLYHNGQNERAGALIDRFLAYYRRLPILEYNN